MVRNEAFRPKPPRIDVQIRPPKTEKTRLSPQERLKCLESEYRSLVQRQDQLLNEVVDSDTPDHYLLSVVSRLRSVELEMERVRADCN